MNLGQKKRGRPKGAVSSNPAKKTLSNVRITDDQLQNYKQAAAKSGKTFSAWVRDILDVGVKKNDRQE